MELGGFRFSMEKGTVAFSPTILFGILILSLNSCGEETSEKRFESIFRSLCSVSIHGRVREAGFEAVWKRLREIDGMMNMWNDDSSFHHIMDISTGGVRWKMNSSRSACWWTGRLIQMVRLWHFWRLELKPDSHWPIDWV